MRTFYLALALSLGGCAQVQSLVHPTPAPPPVRVESKLAVAAPQSTALVPPPNSKTVPLGYNLEISWLASTTYTNGTPLKNTPSYKLYTYNPTTGTYGFQGYMGNVLNTHRVQNALGQVCYLVSVQVYDPNANESAKTGPICVMVTDVTPPPVPGGPVSNPSPVCVK